MKDARGFVKSKELEERVYHIKRVSKKVTGGNAIGFTALAIVGNREGKVGAALGKAKDVSRAIEKAFGKAKDNVVKVNLKGDTIPHQVQHKYAAAEVLLKPAPEGSGIIAGGPIRAVLELAGVKDVSAKMLGSSNKLANVRCTIEALQKLRKIKEDGSE
jgi:small subunit ribosomal protein S5